MVGQFTPLGQQGEFFGLWGLATKLSAIIGPLTYGGMVYLFEGGHRIVMEWTPTTLSGIEVPK